MLLGRADDVVFEKEGSRLIGRLVGPGDAEVAPTPRMVEGAGDLAQGLPVGIPAFRDSYEDNRPFKISV